MRKKLARKIFEFVERNINKKEWTTATASNYLKKFTNLGFIKIKLSRSKITHRGIII
ncbi:MAG: hypothetical protein NZ870_04990 [bacterium]|nr:hypothetical protein [bacterium]